MKTTPIAFAALALVACAGTHAAEPAVADGPDRLTCLRWVPAPWDPVDAGQPRASNGLEQFSCSPTDPFDAARDFLCARSDLSFACISGVNANGVWYSFEADREGELGDYRGRVAIRFASGYLDSHECGQEKSDLLPAEWCP